MKIKNNFLVTMLCLIMSLIGCLGMQIKGDSEIAKPLNFIAGTIADYIVVKYSDKVDKYIGISDKVLNTDVNKEIELAFTEWINTLTSDIKDPFVQRRAQAILNSFEIKTDGINFDFGARRTAREIVDAFRKGLEV